MCVKKSKRSIKKKTLIIIDEKSIKKNKEHNNANLKFVDQLISKKEIKNIANQNWTNRANPEMSRANAKTRVKENRRIESLKVV